MLRMAGPILLVFSIATSAGQDRRRSEAGSTTFDSVRMAATFSRRMIPRFTVLTVEP
jgi:hypothetical protein